MISRLRQKWMSLLAVLTVLTAVIVVALKTDAPPKPQRYAQANEARLRVAAVLLGSYSGQPPKRKHDFYELVRRHRTDYSLIVDSYPEFTQLGGAIVDAWGRDVEIVSVEGVCRAVLSRGKNGKIDFGNDDLILKVPQVSDPPTNEIVIPRRVVEDIDRLNFDSTEGKLASFAMILALWSFDEEGIPITKEDLYDRLDRDTKYSRLISELFPEHQSVSKLIIDVWGNELDILAIDGVCAAVISRGENGRLEYGFGDDLWRPVVLGNVDRAFYYRRDQEHSSY